MISSIRGVVQHISDGEVILEVGGVGLRLNVPADVLDQTPSIGEPMFLQTYLAVRDDALTLYGFVTREQRELFLLLLQVSGVGPRLALAVLSHLSPELIRAAVSRDQPDTLATVPGIGRKSAEKIIFHLKDRLGVAEDFLLATSEADTEVLGALTMLGYNQVEAQAAIQSIPDDADEDVEARIRLALKYFNRP